MAITRLLLVEDNRKDAIFLRDMFAQSASAHIEVTVAQSMAEAEVLLARNGVDIVILDLGLPDARGVEAVRRTHAAAPNVPVVVLTGLDNEPLASQVLQEGAQEHLIKGQIDGRGLLRALRYAAERKAMAVERDAMEEALFVEKERAQVTLNCIGDAVVCTDLFENITFLNPVAERMTGWPEKEARGQALAHVFRLMNAATGAAIADSRALMATAEHRSGERSTCILVRRDGLEVPVESSVSAIHDRQGGMIGAVLLFRDVRAAQAMALRLAHSAEHDSLTGLPNRMLLRDRLSQAIAVGDRYSKRVAVLFLDLDGFKDINDSLGHPVGDKLLQSVAARLVGCVPRSDTVSRQGGDEFIVLSEVARSEDAAIIARRMLQAVATTHSIGPHDLHVTASIGVSAYPEDGADAETLIQNADTAMYQAKRNGRQSYQFFNPAMNARAVERQSIEESMRQALDRNEFSLHYQPKANLRTGEIVGAEALLRWTHPTRGSVSPAQFIRVAEACRLILPIGRWVLREACTQAQLWVQAGLPLVAMAVNISAVEFRAENFLDGVFAVLDETGMDPSFVELELSETVLMKHPESTGLVLQALRDKGIQLAVDHFGTGYSSLSYLGTFPLNALKIDQSLVRQITGAPEQTTTVEAVISMGRSLNLRVVAAGVETQAELAFLRSRECDEAQGYYLGRPVPAGEFATVLATGIAETVLI